MKIKSKIKIIIKNVIKMSLEIELNDQTVYSSEDGSQFIHTESVNSDKKNEIDIDFSSEKGQLYTAVLVDLDAPYPEKSTNSPYLHLLAVNIPGDNIEDGDIIMPYQTPQPPKDSLPHSYVLNVYKQQYRFQPFSLQDRNQFALMSFEQTNGLDLVEQGQFTVGSNIPTNTSNKNMANLNAYAPRDPKYFKDNTSLSDQQQKWCRCTLHVAADQTQHCLENKGWFKQYEGKECYNPYAICSKSVGTSVRTCSENYNFSGIPDEELKAYAYLHDGLEVPKPYNRQQMLDNIQTWKELKGK